MNKIIKSFLACLCATSIIFSSTGYTFADTDRIEDMENYTITLPTGDYQKPVLTFEPTDEISAQYYAIDNNLYDHDLDFYIARSQLSSSGKTAYDLMYNGLKNGVSNINVQAAGITVSEVRNIVYSIMHEHPELFYVEFRFSVSYNSSTGIVTSLIPTYNDLLANKDAVKTQIDSELAHAISVMNTLDSEVEIVKYAHDFIAHNVSYDLEAEYNQNIYSSVVNKSSVCAGYAREFIYLMHKMDIPCCMIDGTSGGGNHAWNLLMLDGEYYLMDVTWDDPVVQDSQGNIYEGDQYIRYTYFNVTDEYIEENDHTRSEFSQTLPYATGTQYSYTNYYHGSSTFTDFDDRGNTVEAITATPYANGALLTWTSVENANGYMVYVYEDGQFSEVIESDDTSETIYNLNENSEYTYAVKATFGWGPFKSYSGRYRKTTFTTGGDQYIYDNVPVSHTITIDSETVATVTEGETYTLPTTANAGYEFGGAMYKPGSTITVMDDMDFTSVVLTNTYTTQIKTDINSGIKFSMKIDGTITDDIQSAGAVLVTASVYRFNKNVTRLLAPNSATDINTTIIDEDGDYSVALSGLADEEGYSTGRRARAYAQIVYTGNGETNETTVYAPISSETSIRTQAIAIRNSILYRSLSSSKKEAIKVLSGIS